MHPTILTIGVLYSLQVWADRVAIQGSTVEESTSKMSHGLALLVTWAQQSPFRTKEKTLCVISGPMRCTMVRKNYS
jgi:hypothetical protein